MGNKVKKVNVGSKNATKVEAVSEVFRKAKFFSEGVEVAGVEISGDKYGHPQTLEKTVTGAIDRAKQAFKDCDYSVGIEGGLMEVPHTKSGFMEVAVCAIYDGKTFHLGLSPACEWPKKVTELILKGLDGSQALREAGFTNHDKIGTAEGGIYILTKGLTTRKEYNAAAVLMALIHLENPEHY